AESRSSGFWRTPGGRWQERLPRAAETPAGRGDAGSGRTATAVAEWQHPQGAPGREVHGEPRTTEDVAATLRMRGQNNHAIPAARPLHLPDAALPIDPYVLGCLLGGGGSRGTGRIACDPEDLAWLVAEFCALGYDPAAWDPGHFGVRGLRSEWRSLGLTAGKHIPAVYLRASSVQRLALAQGLIDSGGYVDD